MIDCITIFWNKPDALRCQRLTALCNIIGFALFVTLLVKAAKGDVTPAEIFRWQGRGSCFMTGKPLAIDSNNDGNVDTIPDATTFLVPASEIPAGAVLIKAYLYWGGTQSQLGGPLSGTPDTMIRLTPPDGNPTLVSANVTYGSDGGSSSYDMFVSRADVTEVISGLISGTYIVDSYSGLVANGLSDNASVSLVLVFTHMSSAFRCIILHDGLMTMSNGSQSLNLANFTMSTVAHGILAYHTMEGDPSGSGVESVTVQSLPGGAPMTLTDDLNPVNNVMNRTINTATPPLDSQVGVDIDRYIIDEGLSGSDSTLNVQYSAGSDRWWLCVNMVAIDVDPGFPESYEEWAETHAPGQDAGEDFDSDGVSNGIEWVLGGGKYECDTNKLPVLHFRNVEWSFEFVRHPQSKTEGTTIQIEVGTTLESWSEVHTVGESPHISVTPNSDGTETVVFVQPNIGHPLSFARLKVTVGL